MSYVSILNLGAGKLMEPDEIKKFVPERLNSPNNSFLVVNVDQMYFDSITPATMESKHNLFLNGLAKLKFEQEKVDCDIFEFMEGYSYRFDLVILHRILEHIERDRLLYFIYLLSTILKQYGFADCIVPNYRNLANMILHESVHAPEFTRRDIILSTELLNERSDPHCSIWTPDRAVYYFTFEERFMLYEKIEPNYLHDGRDIYMHFVVQRIN